MLRGGIAIEGVCKERAQKTCAQNRRNAIAIRCNRRELWQFGADSNSQVARQHTSPIKQVQMAQKSRVGMPVTSGPCSRPSWQLLPLCVRSGRWLCRSEQKSSGLKVKNELWACAQFAVVSEWAVPNTWTLKVKQFIWSPNVASKIKPRRLHGSLPGFDMATTASLDLTTGYGG